MRRVADVKAIVPVAAAVARCIAAHRDGKGAERLIVPGRADLIGHNTRDVILKRQEIDQLHAVHIRGLVARIDKRAVIQALCRGAQILFFAVLRQRSERQCGSAAVVKFKQDLIGRGIDHRHAGVGRERRNHGDLGLQVRDGRRMLGDTGARGKIAEAHLVHAVDIGEERLHVAALIRKPRADAVEHILGILQGVKILVNLEVIAADRAVLVPLQNRIGVRRF